MLLRSSPSACRGPRPGPARAPRSAARPSGLRAQAATSSTAPVDQQQWAEFAQAASGEWEGVTASFGPDGQPQPLPEHYVPSAYRDWGVEIYDWQTTVSSLAQPGTQGELDMMVRRSMPTVGCEADAVAFTEEKMGGGSGASACKLRVISPHGGYVASPAQLGAEDSQARVEFCLPLPAAAAAAAGAEEAGSEGRRQRMRVVHHLQRNWQNGEWALNKVDVHMERYDGPYKGKLDLCGCGGGMPAFAKTEPLKAEALQGSWSVVQAWSSSSASAAAPVAKGLATPAEAGGATRALLPLGAWFCSSVCGKAGDVAIEAGVVTGPGAAQWASCSLHGGVLAGAVLAAGQKA